MPKKITFHRHEVVGAQMARDFMQRVGFSREEIDRVSTLVRNHQFRFYKNTKKSTIRKWLEQFNREDINNIFSIRVADRAGNDKNKNKPLWTQEMKDLHNICRNMITSGEVVLIDSLKVKRKDLYLLKIPQSRHKEAISNMLAIVRANKSRNNRSFLIKYLKDNYRNK